jgi:hypothetical protein
MTVAISSFDIGSQVASGTTISNTLLTVASGVTALLGILWINVSSGAPTMHWDSTGTNQSMTQLGTVANGTVNTYFFGLLAPTTGNHTLSASWTGSSGGCIGAECYTGTATDTLANAFTNFGSNTGSSTTATVTSAGATGNINVCAMGAGTTPAYSAEATTGSATPFLLQNTNIGCTACSAPSAASLVWTATLSATNPWTAISIDVSVPAAPAAILAWPSRAVGFWR